MKRQSSLHQTQRVCVIISTEFRELYKSLKNLIRVRTPRGLQTSLGYAGVWKYLSGFHI